MAEHTAKFVLRGEDKTRAAVESARRHLEEFKQSIFSLKGALAGGIGLVGVSEVVRSLVDANVAGQGIHFTLESALGSSALANKEFTFLAKTADTLGTNLREGARGFSLLAASASASHIPLKTIESLYTGLNKQFAILHTTAPMQQRALIAMDEIMSQGVAHTRQLQRQLSIDLAGSGLVPKLEQRLGLSPIEFEKALKKDELTAQRIIPAIADVLNNVNPTALHDALHSLNADLNRLHNAIFETEIGVGNGGFLTGIESAIVNLTNTLKDPAVQQGLGELATDLGNILSTAARFGADAANGLNQFALALAHVAVSQTGGAPTAKTLGGQLANVRSEIAATIPDLQMYEHYTAVLGGSKYATLIGQLKDQLSTLENEKRNLSTLIAHYGPNASFLNPTNQYDPNGLSSLTEQVQAAYVKAHPGHAPVTTADKNAIASRERIIAALNKEAATYGYTTAQVKLYTLEQLKATPAELKAAKAALATIAAKKAQADASKAAAKAADKEKKSVEELTKSLLNRADPTRQLRAQQQQLEIGYQQKQISAADYAKASTELQQEMLAIDSQIKGASKTINQFAVKAAHSIQTNFAGTFMGIFEHKGNIFQNFAQEFAKMIEQLIAQMLALKVATALFGSSFANGTSTSPGGILGPILGAIFGAAAGGGSSSFGSYSSATGATGGMSGTFGHSGALIGGSVATRGLVNPLAFMGAPRFHSGSVLGLKSGEVPFIGLTGEEVLSRTDPRNRRNGGLGGAGIYAPQVNIDATGAGPDEVAKVIGFGAQLRQMLHSDYEHYHTYGAWPA